MGEETKQKIKKRLKRLLLIIIVVALCLILTSSSTYVIMKWIVKRVTESAKKYTNDVTINDDGTVSTGVTAQELWDNMIEQGYEVDKYLDNADELATLMNAELVTQLPDTRADVTAPIDWDSLMQGSGLDSADWQGDEPEYIELMRKKVKWYEKHHPSYIKNNYVCLIDVDKCRLTILQKNGNSWKLVAAWNTIQGVKRNKWSGTSYAWNGPRSRSFKGVFHVVGKIGTSATCFVGTPNHGTSEDNCQRFEETCYGNPDKLSLEKRFESHGCCNLSEKHAKWIYNNIPVGTTVIAFDDLNPMPNTNTDANETAPSSSNMALTPSEWNKIASQTESEESELTAEESSKINEATGESSNTSTSALVDANGNAITEEQYIEHAKKVKNRVWQYGDLYWHGSVFSNSGGVGMSSGGDICAYTDAIDILWYKDYTIKDIHNKISELDHAVLDQKGLFFFDSEKVNEYYNIKVGKIDRTVEAIKEALSQGKVAATISCSGLWLGGNNSWNNHAHWGVIFYFDGTHFHMKAGGSGEVVDGLYTPEQLKKWLDDGSNNLGRKGKQVYTLARGDGSGSSLSTGSANTSLQGIIKFKRHDKDGNESYLTYSTPTEFQNQVEIYNKSGSSAARDFVMSHFTLKEKTVNGTTDIINGTGSFTQYNLSDNQLNTLARICLREQGSAKGAAAEASLMANLFELAGSSFGSGADGLYNYVMTSGWFGIPGDHNAPGSVNNEELTAVKAVLMQGYRTLPKYVNEHDCINPPDIIDPPARREDFIPFKTVLHNIYGSTYTFYCFPTEDSDPFGYTSEANRQKYGDFCYEYGTWKPINGTEDKNSKEVKATGKKSKKSTDNSDSSESSEASSSSASSNYTGKLDKSAAGEGYPEGTYTSSAGLTYKAYKQGSPAPWAGTSYGDGSHTVGSYGCGVTSIAIILSGLGYDLTPLDVGNGMNYTTNTDYLNNMGVKAQYVSGNISASEVENLLSQGKVIAMHYMGGTFFGGSAPFHYVAIVDADGQGNFMVLNPGGGESGWYSSDKIAENYERVEIDVGSSTRNVSDTSTSSSDGIGYEAVVGTYTEVDKELSYYGPDVEGAAADFGISLDTTPEYTISTTNVNYEDLVKPYTLQFDFLWTLLVTGQSKGFVMDLAKLAYESDIEVSIYDNLITTIDTDNCTYKQVTDGRFSGYVIYSGRYGQTRPIDKHVHKYENGDPLEELDGYINKTVTTRTNTIEYALTRANTWIADYKMSYKYNPPDSNTQTGGYDLSNHKIQPWTVVDYSDGADPCGHIDGIVNEIVSEVNAELQKEYEEKKTAYDSANKSSDNTVGDLGNAPQQEQIDSSDIEKNITMETRIRRVEMHDSTEDITITQKYTAETPSAIIKDDEKTKPNFVTLFNDYKYRDNRNSILSAVEWIFEIMEENEDLANILDIFKYLLYKSTGVSYGVTELDETLFFPPDLIEMDSQIEGGTIEEKVWWAVIDAGYSKEAAAGVMGNIYAESEFNASLIEAGNGIGAGLCQWSYERRTSLEKYAKSKGKKWSDEDTQIEFLIAEITPGGGANGYASYQLTTYNGYGPSDWKKASTPEDAAVAFCWSFERPGIPRMDIRKSKAKEYYNKYKNSSKSTAGSGAKYANASNSEKLKFLFPNGAPTSAKQMEQYLTTISVPITQKNGVKTTTSVVLHKAIAKDVYNACAAAQAEGFKVYEIGGYREFGTDSAGAISGLTTQSQHCYGLAVDINVNENAMYDYGSPSVGSFYNPSGSEYSVKKNGAFMKTLKSAGWGWGGDWPGNRQDYMHFSYMGY